VIVAVYENFCNWGLLEFRNYSGITSFVSADGWKYMSLTKVIILKTSNGFTKTFPCGKGKKLS